MTVHWGCPNHGTHCLAEGSARFLAAAARDCSLCVSGSIFAGPSEERFTLSPEDRQVCAAALPHALGQPVLRGERREPRADAAKVTQ